MELGNLVITSTLEEHCDTHNIIIEPFLDQYVGKQWGELSPDDLQANYDFFQGTRILVRRIVNRQFRLMSTITNDEFVCKKDIYIAKLINDGYMY